MTSYRRSLVSSFETDKTMLRKMYFIPADQLYGSAFMSREPSAVSKRKHRETVKKRNPYSEAIKIRNHHPYEEWLKMRHKKDEDDPRKKYSTKAFADILIRLMPTGQSSNVPLLHHRLLRQRHHRLKSSNMNLRNKTCCGR